MFGYANAVFAAAIVLSIISGFTAIFTAVAWATAAWDSRNWPYVTVIIGCLLLCIAGAGLAAGLSVSL